MTAALLSGLAVGVGLWVTITAAKPAPVPLARALTDLTRPPASTGQPVGGGGRVLGWLGRWGLPGPARTRRLALAGITPQVWARDKLLWVGLGVGVPLAVWVALGVLGVRLPAPVGLVAVAGGVAGWWLPERRLSERVEARRRAFSYALSAYLDLVNVILAGGGGTETALVAAADAGEGWAFAELRRALGRARRINQPLWTAFDDLGAELDVAELRELASSLALAGSQGARIRASLAVKADTLRAHQIAETEAAAEATTERMNLPTAVLLLGFLIFIVFPAITAITGITVEEGCPPDGVCHPAPPADGLEMSPSAGTVPPVP
jgi:tight adherence protein C